MEPIEYLRVIRRRWRLLALCVVVAAVVTWVITPANPTNPTVSYAATHTLIRDTQQGAVPQSLPTVALYVKTGEVPERAADRVGFDGEPALLAGRVTLEPDEQVGTLAITATGGTRQEAAELANAFAEATLSYLGRQAQEAQQAQIEQVNERVTQLQVDIEALETEISQAEEAGRPTGTIEAERDSKIRQYGAALDQQQQILASSAPGAGYLTLQDALPELASAEAGGFSAPRSRVSRTVLATVVGFLLGLAAVFVAERLDTRIRTRQGAEEVFRLPVITEIPVVDQPSGQILTAVDPMSAAAEAYRTLRASLLLTPATDLRSSNGSEPRTSDGAEPQVVLVTSPSPGDGKTTTVANLAVAFAETGRTVLVLGCDFRRPEIHRLFESPPKPGIAEVLAHDSPLQLRDIVRATPVSGVYLAPSGNALTNLGHVAAAGPELLHEARSLADIVLIDTAPLLATNEASEFVAESDRVVIVARAGRTTDDASRRTRALLDRLGGRVSGVALIGTGIAGAGYGDYYTTLTPQPPRRKGLRLRRGVRSGEIIDRIEPWHGSEPARDRAGPPTAEAEAPRDPGPSARR